MPQKSSVSKEHPAYYKPHNGPQTKFHQTTAFEVGYGGAAGGGKSEATLRELLRQIHIPGYKAIYFRRTFPELEASAIERAFQIYPFHGGVPKDQGRRWFFPTSEPSMPAQIRFSHLEYDSDVHKHQSAQYDVIALDEATSFTEYQYTYLRSRIRGVNPNIKRKYILCTNPGNIGHTWFKKRFIDNQVPLKKSYFKVVNDEEIITDQDDPDALSRIFIPAKIQDNPTLLKADPGYLNRLKSLDEVTRRMLLDGDWDVFAGQYFQEFRRSSHVFDITKVFPAGIPEDYKKYVGIDYGLSAPFAALWIAIDYDGNIYVYREYYQAGKTAIENAQAIKRLSEDEKIHAFFIDPSTFGKSGEHGRTIATAIRGEGVPVVAASNRRVDGWNILKQYLTSNNSKPNLHIASNCVNLIRTFPMMIHDKHRPEDLDTTLEDHCLDALRYGIISLHEKRTPKPLNPIEKKIQSFLTKSTSFFNPNDFYAQH